MRYTAPAGQAGLLSFRRAWKQVPLHELHNTQTEYITMKKTLITLIALAGVASADTVLFDFDEADLTATGLTTVTLSDLDSGINAIISTNGTLVGGDWSDAPANNTVATPAVGSAEYDFIKSSGKGTPLTLTFSGLTAGSVYDITIATGVPFEGAGAWNTLTPSTGFTYTSATKTTSTGPTIIESLDQQVTVKEVSTFTFTGVTANESGEIAFEIKTTGAHTPSFNSAAITLVPEPATATLSLLALAGLAARRRRH